MLACSFLVVLRENRARRGRYHVPREQRVCRCCGTESQIEDEKHVLLECPAYDDIRTQEDFEKQTSMLEVMKWEPARLAKMLERMWAHRNSIVPFAR